jgi:hypothetical protein
VSHALNPARPESTSSGDNPARFARVRRVGRGRVVVGVVVPCLILGAWVASLVLAPSSASQTNREGAILVVGDSLVLQATKALRSWNLPSVPIIADGGLGSAPCDWEKGYTDPLTGHYVKFSEVFQNTRPTAVVFAFTGNPGLGSHSTGCVNSSGSSRLSRPPTLTCKMCGSRRAMKPHHGKMWCGCGATSGSARRMGPILTSCRPPDLSFLEWVSDRSR